MNYCKLSGLNNTNLIPYYSEGQKSEMGLNVLKKKKKSIHRVVFPLEGLEENLLSYLF